MKKEDFTQLIHHHTEYFNLREFYAGNKEGMPKKQEVKNVMITECTAGTGGSRFVSISTRNCSCFSVYKEYGPTGIIRCKWVTFRNRGAAVGKKYLFGPDGKLTAAEDEEEGFGYTPHQVIQFCRENHINLFSEDTCIERYANRRNKEFYYIIRYLGRYQEKSGIIVMFLNGHDGNPERIIVTDAGL